APMAHSGEGRERDLGHRVGDRVIGHLAEPVGHRIEAETGRTEDAADRQVVEVSGQETESALEQEALARAEDVAGGVAVQGGTYAVGSEPEQDGGERQEARELACYEAPAACAERRQPDR